MLPSLLTFLAHSALVLAAPTQIVLDELLSDVGAGGVSGTGVHEIHVVVDIADGLKEMHTENRDSITAKPTVDNIVEMLEQHAFKVEEINTALVAMSSYGDILKPGTLAGAIAPNATAVMKAISGSGPFADTNNATSITLAFENVVGSLDDINKKMFYLGHGILKNIPAFWQPLIGNMTTWKGLYTDLGNTVIATYSKKIDNYEDEAEYIKSLCSDFNVTADRAINAFPKTSESLFEL